MTPERRLGGPEEAVAVASHLRRMRIWWLVGLVTVPIALIAAFLLPRLDPAGATRTSVTLVALAAGMWIAFTAERDARVRLDRARNAFVVHGDIELLLRDHFKVFLVVLVRLELILVFGLVVAVWGSGPRVAVWFALLAGLMIVLAWPSEHKSRLVIARGRQAQEEAES
jgi:hypothetical protein